MNLILLIFVSASRLAWQACLKKTGVKVESLADINMLLMVGKGSRDGICHVINRYAKVSNKYMKNCNKSKEPSYLMYLDANNLYGWAVSQTLPGNGFKWKKNVSKFDEDFIKNYNENSNKEYILEVDIEYPKNLLNFHGDLPFLAEREKIKKMQ